MRTSLGRGQASSVDWTHSYFEHAYLKRWALEPPTASTQAEAAHLLSLLRPAVDAPLLDVACGHGRYAIALAALGGRLVGLDNSRALLQRATLHASKGPVRPQWVQADMRKLPFAPRFGGALLLDSFGFFASDDENALVLRELRRILLPEGRVIIAIANARPIVTNFRANDIERRGSLVFEIHRVLQERPVRMVERIAVHQSGGTTHYERRQRLYSRAEFEAQLREAGFTVQGIAADYTGGAFDEMASSKVVTLAQAAA